MESAKFDIAELREIFTCIGLANPAGLLYDEKLRKHGQVVCYLEQVRAALRKLSTKREIVFLDCGCGKSYLSFVVNKYCSQIMERKVYFVGVDTNAELVEKCRGAAESLGLANMEFHCGDIMDFAGRREVDVAYCLHACDTGTDQTIARGVLDGARYIFAVSCCQHTSRKQLRADGLASLTRFKDYKERIGDMIGDAMRALLLESLDYKVNVFEFCPSTYGPKNIMLRGVKCGFSPKRTELALAQYKDLCKRFNIRPATEKYLEPLLADVSRTYVSEIQGDRVFA